MDEAAERGALEVPGVLAEAVAVAEDDGAGGGPLTPEKPPQTPVGAGGCTIAHAAGHLGLVGLVDLVDLVTS
ncbi:hypothetical protein SNARM312S_06804 [Streptomyces narbonensis]